MKKNGKGKKEKPPVCDSDSSGEEETGRKRVTLAVVKTKSKEKSQKSRKEIPCDPRTLDAEQWMRECFPHSVQFIKKWQKRYEWWQPTF
uniref:Uncharacterized protein n=1 Tax=Knipowitschia caucasica TaxID=637954 RepID=A0AAV2LS53_KNICA